MDADVKQNILDKQKNVETMAEYLDNTASFKTILNSINGKRKKGKTLSNYIHYTVKRRKLPGVLFCHSDFMMPANPRSVFTEDWDGGLNSGFFDGFSYKSALPYLITEVCNANKSDPVLDVMKETLNWKQRWADAKGRHKVMDNNKKRKGSYKWLDDNLLYCSKYLVDMAEHLMTKPDQFFEDNYNWYYAGNGNIHIAQFNGSEYLIHSEFNCLSVSAFFKDNLSIDHANTVTYCCSEDTNIFETALSENIIALRTKCKVIILKLSIAEDMRLEKLKEIDSELPFTSISFDGHHKNILYVTSLDYQLTIVNVDRMTGRSKKLRGKFPSLVDNWSSVIGSERGHFTHVTNKSLTLYDKRTNEPFQRWKSVPSISDIVTCARITGAKYCQGKPLLYLSTNHHLFLVDMRCGTTKDTNIKALQRWTHGMISPPTYMAMCNHDQKEMICLSSQWFEDMCVVSNYSDTLTRKGEIPGLTLPYRPPSLVKTLVEAQRKLMFSTLDDLLRHRFCTSVTGISIVEQGDACSVLTQNSLGDISRHALYPKQIFAFIEDDGPERLHQWSRNYNPKPTSFEVTRLLDISPLWNRLKQVPDDYILGHNLAIKPRFKFNEKEIYETFAKEEVDPEILDIWKESHENEDFEITLDKTETSKFFVDMDE